MRYMEGKKVKKQRSKCLYIGLRFGCNMRKSKGMFCPQCEGYFCMMFFVMYKLFILEMHRKVLSNYVLKRFLLEIRKTDVTPCSALPVQILEYPRSKSGKAIGSTSGSTAPKREDAR